MQKIKPSMCLKVQRDLFIYPEANKGVYLRNNVTSIRMDGSTIEKWLEKLIPMLDGSLTLDEVTNGLPDTYKEQVYKIVHVLFENGFIRDVSQDLPHQLPDHILTKYASQIEFINYSRDSGAYRFQKYREAKVAVVGSGPLLHSLVLSLIQSGLHGFTIHTSQMADDSRLQEMIAEATVADSDTKITILKGESNSERLKKFDYIIYGSMESDSDQLCAVQEICIEHGKSFLPVTLEKNLAFVGPFVSAESRSCWKSAYRRLHQTASGCGYSYSSTACGLLANVAVFELFKEITGISEVKKESLIYKLNLETLEGNWHPVIPHPLVTGTLHAEHLSDPLLHVNDALQSQKDLHSFFFQITSSDTGILHKWEEDDLLQLPLSQCKVSVTDPRSESTSLLTEMVCSGLTHEEARIESGLTGIETYTKCLFDDCTSAMSIGTGQTAAEGLCRALQNSLHEAFVKSVNYGVTSEMEVNAISDQRCHFMMKALSTFYPESKVYHGVKHLGFPVVWVNAGDQWYGSAGLNTKLALERALKTAVMDVQNKKNHFTPYGVKVSSVLNLTPSSNDFTERIVEQSHQEMLVSALQTLKSNSVRVQFFSLQAEAIMNEHTAGIFGVTLGGEGRS